MKFLSIAMILFEVTSSLGAGTGPFTTIGNKIYDSDNNWIVFKGIGLSCTEYCARPNMPIPDTLSSKSRLESWPGEYCYNGCFGGAPSLNATLELNAEIVNVANYLTGINFAKTPIISKVSWPSPYNQVVSPGSPQAVPIVRIPITSSTYMFDAEANELKSEGYRKIIDLIIQNLTSQGIAVIIDQHEDCAGGGQAECNYPDMRDFNGVLTNGSSGGANWASVWADYVSTSTITVRDDGDKSKINVTDYEVEGFLPRPCIVPNFGMGDSCGWPLGFNISKLPWNSMWNQTVGESVLPGLPPSGIPSSCLLQACEDYSCSPYSSVIPMPQPCA